MRKLVLFLAALVCGSMSLHAQNVTVNGSQLGGSTPVTGTITFTPTLSNGQPASAHIGGGGQSVTTPVTARVTAGAFTATLLDTSTTNPANICYAVTVRRTDGAQVMGSGYSCVQPATNNFWCSAGVCNFDNYTPNLAPLALVQSGPKGDTGATGAQGATGATGAQGPAGAGYMAGVSSDGADGVTVAGKVTASTLSAGSTVIAPGQGVWHRRGVVVFPDPTIGASNNTLTGEPTVMYEGSPLILTGASNVWKMWYTMASAIYYAESLDGVTWVRWTGPLSYGSIAPCQHSFVIKNSATYYLYCDANAHKIDEYTSTDGGHFTLVQSGVINNWPTNDSSNTSGIVQGGTLYLLVETGGPVKAYSSTDFQHFTFVQDVSGLYAMGGMSLPYLINGKWYLWVHSYSLPGSMYRMSASSLLGPYSNTESGPYPIGGTAGADFWPQTSDEGTNTSFSQTVDPYLYELNGKTYLFYSSGSQSPNSSQVKLAVADMPISSLVLTGGGPIGGAYENSGLGVSYDVANNTLNLQGRGLENVGSIAGTIQTLVLGSSLTTPHITAPTLTVDAATTGDGQGTLWVKQFTMTNSYGDYQGYLNRSTLTANRTWTLPNLSGTFAMTSQLPGLVQTFTDFIANNGSTINVDATTAGDRGGSLLGKQYCMLVSAGGYNACFTVPTLASSNRTYSMPDASGNTVVIWGGPATPADNAACSVGYMWFDASYLYLCTAPGTVKRTPLSTY